MKPILPTLLLGTLLSFCSHKGSQQPIAEPTAPPVVAKPQEPIKEEPKYVSSDPIDGRWKSNCVDKNIRELKNKSGFQTYISHDYADDDCKVETGYVTAQRLYETEGNHFNCTFLTFIITDLVKGTKTDVTGEFFAPSKGDKFYQIFEIEDGELTFGAVDDAHSSMTPEARPTELTLDYVYKKI